MYHLTKVGELFIPGRTQYPEGVRFEYAESGPYLIFTFRNPSPEEIEAVRKGKVELALHETSPVLWILHRIEGLEQWSDCPFSIRIYDGMGRKFDWSEEIEDGKGIGLNVILVEASTGVLLVQRLVGLSTKFSRELRSAILRQIEQPFSKADYAATVDRIYTNYSTKKLLSWSTVKCKIGE
jgi:hypothetical protein